jgi:hypothetical protein
LPSAHAPPIPNTKVNASTAARIAWLFLIPTSLG